MQKKFEVNGMMCAACQANVERAVAKLPGVASVNVSLLGKSMVVDFDPEKVSIEQINETVDGAGYQCSLFVNETLAEIQAKRKRALRQRKTKLLWSVVLLLCLMVFSMGPMIPPVMEAIDKSGHVIEICLANVAAQFVFLVPILILNRHHFVSGVKSLIKLHPNMDALVTLGSFVSTIYGIVTYGFMISYAVAGNADAVMKASMNIYVESAAMIPVFVSIGKYFEAKATEKTTASIASLMALTPETSLLCKENGEIVEVPTATLEVGDIVMVKPGMSIPTDGEIVEGYANVDESAISGESMVIYKTVGQKVIGASVNKDGSFKFKVTSVGEDTTIAKIISLVEEASQSKAPIARLADRIALVFVPAVIVLSLITFTIWMILSGLGIAGEQSPDLNLSFQLAVSVLVISCPCALGLATPVAIMVGTGKGAENGILIKSAEAFERLEKVDVVLFDKTGTLTKGEMTVKEVVTYEGSKEDIVKEAAALESRSEHPLSKAIVAYAEKKGIEFVASESFSYHPGLGLEGDGLLIGNLALMKQNGVDASLAEEDFEKLSKQGKTVLFYAKNKKVLALFAIGDALKENAAKTIKTLQNEGKKVAILTGDNEFAANYIAAELGVDEVYAGILPADKESIVASFQSKGLKVAMVGDGVNDAPALTRADVGIAIGAGTDIAIESSDIILVRSDPTDVASAIRLSKKVVKNIKENLAWAFFYNLILIPIAAGALYAIRVSPNWFTGSQTHLVLTPMIGSLAMSLSSITVILNALRLNRFKFEIEE
ncbi:MAG: copper-translocating P-type ATPase [Erysipelotrichaceae bacterium]|jgi:Cu+-exporting ATPase|nr:copper-translocating P-type ATPase [Erysipelotrichaceae bacterium]